jgi:hypothetical protein
MSRYGNNVSNENSVNVAKLAVEYVLFEHHQQHRRCDL